MFSGFHVLLEQKFVRSRGLLQVSIGDSILFLAMAARLIANLIVMGSGIMARAFVQAYRQALVNASKNGVAQEAAQHMKRGSKMMTDAEARQILGVSENSTWEEILKRYDNLFERNAKNGSFYLQSKVHRAKECLETLHQPKEPGTS
ncbi:Protein Transporter- Pam16 [Striga hermonthica]|uniref:Protein Transporter- Pam16 n=1 Tax=Striga hermonthica TaxID=68872 RepID=A0A9N7MHV5_STRHE|nr:Protein Transporter- Pam16 [Striga hermonthica]